MDEMYTQNGPEMTPKKTPGMAIASLVLGIVSIVTGCCIYYLSIPCAILAIVFGVIVLRKNEGGRGMCIAGIICGAVGILLSILLIIFAGILIASVPELQYYLD